MDHHKLMTQRSIRFIQWSHYYTRRSGRGAGERGRKSLRDKSQVDEIKREIGFKNYASMCFVVARRLSISVCGSSLIKWIVFEDINCKIFRGRKQKTPKIEQRQLKYKQSASVVKRDIERTRNRRKQQWLHQEYVSSEDRTGFGKTKVSSRVMAGDKDEKGCAQQSSKINLKLRSGRVDTVVNGTESCKCLQTL